jgi:hypothetical protein
MHIHDVIVARDESIWALEVRSAYLLRVCKYVYILVVCMYMYACMCVMVLLHGMNRYGLLRCVAAYLLRV